MLQRVSEMENTCLLCPFTGSNSQELSLHLIKYHRNDSRFIVKCGYCSATYRVYDSYKKHLYRKHSVTIDVDNVIEPESVYEFASTSSNVTQSQTLEEEIQRKAAGLILKLKGQHNVSQVAVDCVLDNVSDILNIVQRHTHATVKQHQEDTGCSVNSILSDEVFNVSLQCLRSKHMQNNFFVDTYGMVEPQLVELGEKLTVSSGSSGRLQSQVVKCYGCIVPFRQNLIKLLSCPEVKNEVLRGHASSSSYLYDVCDGEYIKKHPLTHCGHPFLRFLLFCDDLEVCNPVGSHTKVHKITVWYWQMLNIHPLYRSRLSSIQLLAIAKSAYIRRFGMERILNDFKLCMQELAQGCDMPEVGHCVGALVSVVADTPAANQIGGFKEGVGFAKRKCRTCDCNPEDMTKYFSEQDFRLRSEDQHIVRCTTLSNLSPSARQYWSKEYGINSRSLLMDLPFFHVTECLVHDIMHVLFEGICPFELKLAFQKFVCDQKFFTINQLNGAISAYPYTHGWKRNKPAQIDKKLLSDDSRGLKQDSSQIWCLLMHLPFLIGAFVPEGDEHWLNIVRLQQIVQLCTSHRADDLTVAQLEHLIKTHNSHFTYLYPQASYIPKLHFLVHIPSQIHRFGPAKNLWAMRMEAKNGKFKRKKWSNFRNVPLSLSVYHQQSMCYDQSAPFYLHFPEEACEGDLVDVLQYEHRNALVSAGILPWSDNVMITICRSITVHGTPYSTDDILYYRRDSEVTTPYFARIVHCVSTDTYKCLVMQLLDVTSFNPHLNCYTVSSVAGNCVFALEVKDLWCPKPCIVNREHVLVTADCVVECL